MEATAGKRMQQIPQGATLSLYELYESTPQSAGLTLTVAQCDEIAAMGIPWPISGDLSRTQPVRHKTLTLRYGKGDHDTEEEAA